MMSRYLILALFFAVATFNAPSTTQEPLDVSMVQVLANPKAFDGKLIRVTGFLRIEFEGNELYLHKEDYLHSIYLNGVWVELTRDGMRENMPLDQNYVLVEGTFDSTNRGHNGLASGAITKIQRMELWSKSRAR